MGGAQYVEGKALWGLHHNEFFAGQGGAHQQRGAWVVLPARFIRPARSIWPVRGGPHLFDRIRNGQAGDYTHGPGVQGVQHGVVQAGRGQGAGRIVNKHAVAIRGQCRQARGHGFLTQARAAGHAGKGQAQMKALRQAGDFRSALRKVVFRQHKDNAPEPRHMGGGQSRMPIQGAAAQGEKLFGAGQPGRAQPRPLPGGQKHKPGLSGVSCGVGKRQ